MQDVWTRIETWLAAHASKVRESLNEGVTGQEIEETEAFLGVTFPDDVRASYRIHNGLVLKNGFGVGFIDEWEFLSLEEIKRTWMLWKDQLDNGDFELARGAPRGPILTDWWDPKWVPLTYDLCGNHHCLDLDPAPGGKVGQIILLWHDDAVRRLVAPSFREWFENFADDLEAGKYEYSEKFEGLTAKKG